MMSTKLQSISGIIVTYNRAQDLARTLNHIRRDGVGISELIVVDNASTDGTSELVTKQFPEVKLVRLHDNTGVCFARNVGVANAKGELLLFIDDDCFVDFAAIRAAVEQMTLDDRLAVVGFNVVNLMLDDALKVYESKGFERYKTGESSESIFFSGGACLIRRDVFVELGGYDDQLFYLVEESDFAIRLFSRGYKIKKNGDIVCLHYASPHSRPSARRIFYHYRNWLIVIAKHYPFPFCFIEILGLIMVGLKRSIRDRQFGAYVKGILWGMASVLFSRVDRRPLSYGVFVQYYRRRVAHRRNIVARLVREIDDYWRRQHDHTNYSR